MLCLEFINTQPLQKSVQHISNVLWKSTPISREGTQENFSASSRLLVYFLTRCAGVSTIRCVEQLHRTLAIPKFGQQIARIVIAVRTWGGIGPQQRQTNSGIAPEQPRGHVGCEGVATGRAFCGRRFSKAKRCTTQKRPVDYVALACNLLQKMNPTQRREIIEKHMQQGQRIDLEAYMRAQKNRQTELGADLPPHVLAIRDKVPDSGGDTCAQKGIYKSACGGKVYAYYAKAGIQNLMFVTRTHKDLADAVRDHIILMEILEHIRLRVGHEDFPTKVREAVAQVLAEAGLQHQDFFRSFSATCTAHHWIGRGLSVSRTCLDAALQAWTAFNEARGEALFHGGMPSPAYTPQKADKQWERIKAAYVMLQDQNGRAQQTKAWLAHMEATHRPMLIKKIARWNAAHWKAWEKRASKSDTAAFQHAVKLLARWTRESARKHLQETRGKAHAPKTWFRGCCKRRAEDRGTFGTGKRRKTCVEPDDARCTVDA